MTEITTEELAAIRAWREDGDSVSREHRACTAIDAILARTQPPWEPSDEDAAAYCDARGWDVGLDGGSARRNMLAARTRGWDAVPRRLDVDGSGLPGRVLSGQPGAGKSPGPSSAPQGHSVTTDQSVPVPVDLLRRLKATYPLPSPNDADVIDALVACIPPPRKRPTEAAVMDFIRAMDWPDDPDDHYVRDRAVECLTGFAHRLHPSALEDETP
jgi:hypothetical protein